MQTAGDEEAFLETEREYMVETQLRPRHIKDRRVLQAMTQVPRHLFVPQEYRHLAYTDGPLPIGYGQTISQPYIVALMSQVLELQGSERVLEVGTGSGYQAAVLSCLAAEVHTIERFPDLSQAAQQILSQLGYQQCQRTRGGRHRRPAGICSLPGHSSYGCRTPRAASFAPAVPGQCQSRRPRYPVPDGPDHAASPPPLRSDTVDPDRFRIDAMVNDAAYAHPVTKLELRETHISRIVLTGPYAYKIKKPVRFPFLDASTLERRRRLCEEELRLNRRFAPDLYVDVVPIARDGGRLVVGGTGEPDEFAVRMHQFDPSQELAVRLDQHDVTPADMRSIASQVAGLHRRAAVAPAGQASFLYWF